MSYKDPLLPYIAKFHRRNYICQKKYICVTLSRTINLTWFYLSNLYLMYLIGWPMNTHLWMTSVILISKWVTSWSGRKNNQKCYYITVTSLWAWWRLKSPAYNCSLNRLFRQRSKKTSKLHVTGLCAGNSPVAGEFPAQMASNAENAGWRHHDLLILCVFVCVI